MSNDINHLLQGQSGVGYATSGYAQAAYEEPAVGKREKMSLALSLVNELRNGNQDDPLYVLARKTLTEILEG